MCKRSIAFTLIELLVVVAIIALLIAILLPSLASARESAKRGVCAQNIKGLASACKTYSLDNQGWWPTVGSWYDKPVLADSDPKLPGDDDYKPFFLSMGGTMALPRDRESIETREPDPDLKSTNVSASRALWLLIRRGDVAPGSTICPSSDDVSEPATDTLRFYDFKGYGYLSYAYQMPFFTRYNHCRPKQDIGVDPRMVFLGDKSPGMNASTTVQAVESASGPPSDILAFNSTFVGTATGGDGGTALKDIPPANDLPNNGLAGKNVTQEQFKPFNSPNHGGRGQGEGQNVGRADGSAEFATTPLAGVDRDNIYSVFFPVPTYDFGYRIMTGAFPVTNSTNWGCPGYRGISNNRNSSTDTLLIP